MAYEEAQQLLKTQSHLSLTVLKPSISTASSHRSNLSLAQMMINDIIGEVGIDIVGNNNSTIKTSNTITTESADSLASSVDGAPSLPPSITALVPSSSMTSTTAALMMQPHMRSPSAPDFLLQHHQQQQHQHNQSLHGKSMSIIHGMSDYEIKKALNELTEEQVRRREHEQLEMIDETNNSNNNGNNYPRSPSGNSWGGGRGAGFRSTTSITNSINSSGSGAGRIYTDPRLSSPLNLIRSDPLALEPGSGTRTMGQASSSATTSNTSVNSASQQSRIRKSNAAGTSQTGCSHSLPYHYHNALTGPACIQNTDNASDRHTAVSTISHASTATSKQGSSRSVGPLYNNNNSNSANNNNSSHGSWNSDFSESSPAPRHHVKPDVYEEEEEPEASSFVPSIPRPRERSRSSTVSLTSSSGPYRNFVGTLSSPASSRCSTTDLVRRRCETKSSR